MVGSATDIQIVIFRIGNERYALPTATAREVISYDTPRRLPGADRWVEGVINLRGEIIPICDLMLAMGMDPVVAREQVIVCDMDGGSVGLVVEEVSSVIGISREEITRPASLTHPALAGLVQRDNGLVVLLDLHAALSSDTGTGTSITSIVAELHSQQPDVSTELEEAA